MRSIKKALKQAKAQDVYVTFPVRSKRSLNKVLLFLRNQGIKRGKVPVYYLGCGDPHIVVLNHKRGADLHTHDCWSCLSKRNPPYKIHHGTLRV